MAPLIALSRHGLEWFLTTAPMPASQPASYPYLSLSPVSPSFSPSCVILLFMLLFPSFSHCAHLTYNYVDDIVVYVASVAATAAAAAAAAVSYCRSSSNKGRRRREGEEEDNADKFYVHSGPAAIAATAVDAVHHAHIRPATHTHSLTLIFAVAFIVGPYISFPAPVPVPPRISLTYLYGRSCILIIIFFFYCYRFIAICCGSSFQFSSLRSSSFVFSFHFYFYFFIISIFIFNLAALIKNSFGVKCAARCPLPVSSCSRVSLWVRLSLVSHNRSVAASMCNLVWLPTIEKKTRPETSSIYNLILYFCYG